MRRSLTREQGAWHALQSNFMGDRLVFSYDRARLLMAVYSQMDLLYRECRLFSFPG